MTQEAWIVEESRLARAARRAPVRALCRPGRLLAIGLAAAMAFVAFRLYRPPAYQAMLHFHLAEGDLTDPTQGPRPPRTVREYVANVALSRERVEQIMRKHGWSTRYLAVNPVAAVDEFRDDVDVEVSRNYFLYDRRPSDAPRYALVTVSLLGSDAEQTRATLREIGEAIVDHQRRERAVPLQGRGEVLDAELARARARAGEIQQRIARLQEEAADSRRAADLHARIVALQGEAEAAVGRLLALERRATDVAFTSAAESEELGLRLDLVDEGLVALRGELTPLQLAGRALVVFGAALIFAAPVAGAFDDRIYGIEDLAARDLPVLGTLRRCPGDEPGSRVSRSRARGV